MRQVCGRQALPGWMLFLCNPLASSASAQLPSIVDLSQTSADVTVLGAATADKTGYRLACGDYDGDGLTDLVVLSSGQAGATGFPFLHVFWGDSPLPTTADLATYAGHVSYVRAVSGDDGFWAWIGSGDFDGDTIDDIALGMPCNEFNCTGKVYLIFGKSDFPSFVDLTNPTTDVVHVLGISGGVGFGGFLGKMLAVGDVNGDAVDDLVVSAPELSPGGHVYILWGGQTMPSTIELSNSTTNVARLIDPRNSQNSGTALACGDANHDGFDDLLIGSPEGGEVMLALGASAFADTILLDGLPVKRFRKSNWDGMGWRVEFVDFNGDNYDDMLMSTLYASPLGCEYCGDVMVAYGSDVLPDVVVVDSPTAPVTRMFGVGFSQAYGSELASGDVNADGYGDILVASVPDEYNTSDVGKVTIVYGSASPPDTVLLGAGALLTKVYAESRPDGFGAGLLSCDVDMDGTDDVIVGAQRADVAARISAGKAYVLYGVPESTTVDHNPRDAWRLGQNYPNPFNPRTLIPISLPRREYVSLHVYDAHGRRITGLLTGPLDAGDYRIAWDGKDERGRPVASGVYFYRLVGGLFDETRKMVLLR